MYVDSITIGYCEINAFSNMAIRSILSMLVFKLLLKSVKLAGLKKHCKCENELSPCR